jgi:nucleotide-binding universal stress UspA family protein
MSVAIAYKAAPTAQAVLLEAAREAQYRQTSLTVIEVELMASMDLDTVESHSSGLREEVVGIIGRAGIKDLDVDVLVSTGSDNVADISHAVLARARDADAELLVIGARRRSPAGKFLLGSSTQSIILDAEIPVLVVKIPK